MKALGFADNKYTLVRYEDGKTLALRYGEAWRDTTGDNLIAMMAESIDAMQEQLAKPIDMILHCPNCGEQHIDVANGEWTNPPHRSHLCKQCGCVWRPADVPTNGVAEIETRGQIDWHPRLYRARRGEHGK